MKLEFADLYYIPNFQFPNGGTRNKYLVVLTDTHENKLLLSLPTKVGRVPDHLENGQSGCINCDKSQFNCYRFLKNHEVTEDEPPFAFPLDTFIYGEWIQDWNSTTLKMDYAVESVDYIFKGKLKKELIKDIILCFTNSTKVKMKYKKIFKELYQQLD